MDFDPRDIDSRDDERHGYNRDDARWDERERDDDRERSFDPRDVFTRDMNLPRGLEREVVRHRHGTRGMPRREVGHKHGWRRAL